MSMLSSINLPVADFCYEMLMASRTVLISFSSVSSV